MIKRLQQLDIELSVQGEKLSHCVYAVRNEIRIKIYVRRRPAGDFRAEATIGNERLYSVGRLPSHAYIKLITQIRWALDKMIVERNFTNGVANRLR